MPLTAEQAQQKVSALSKRLEERRPAIQNRLNYLTGDNGYLRFAGDKFREYNKTRYEGLSDNWCLPVASAPAERMTFMGVRPAGETSGVDSELQRDWETLNGDASSSEAFLMQSAASRSFALVQPGDTEGDVPNLSFIHPSNAITERDAVTGREKFGFVAWADEGGENERAAFYTDDEIWHFERAPEVRIWLNDKDLAPINGWRISGEPEENVLGEVPLSEIPNQRLLGNDPMSDIDGVMALQDAANLIWAYLMNGLDAASLPQRVVTGSDVPKVPILDESGQVVGHEEVDLDALNQEKIIFLPGDAAKIAEWSAAQLDVFWQVVERIVEHIAAQTRTPPHYLVAKMVNTSGDALNIAEAGLVSKVGERITYATPGMKKTMRLMAIARGADRKRVANISAGKLLWKPFQYRSDAQTADAMGKLKSAGMPMRWIVEQLVTDPGEVARVMEMVDEERRMDPLRAAQEAMRQGEDFPAPQSATPEPLYVES